MTRLADIVATSARVAATGSRKEKSVAVAGALASLEPGEIATGARFLAGIPSLVPLGIGYAALRTADATPAALESRLSILEVADALAAIAALAGKGSATERARHLARLFGRATHQEQAWLTGLLAGELRQGALEGLLLDAIAIAAAAPLGLVRRAAMLSGDVGEVARAALLEGPVALSRFGIELMRPVLPMLAQPAGDVAEALDQLGPAAFEWKVDGARVQVHKRGDEVRVYTRNLNDVTAAVPEVTTAIARAGARDLVLDGEAIVRTADGTPAPFQITMRRFGRKKGTGDLKHSLPLVAWFFDCLHRDGVSLLDEPGRDRIAHLGEVLPPELVIPRIETGDLATAEAFLADAVRQGHEGVMAKATGATYEAGSRGAGWRKIKQVHTLDLVVLAAEWGNGRRRGWLSNLHLGARAADGSFVMLGKTFKGMTDQLLEWQTKALLEREIGREGVTVHVRPELVVEIAFNDLQESSQYPGGLALRFARVKGYRLDKTVAEADTIETVRAIYAGSRARWDAAAESSPPMLAARS